jgi:hypothetical protein
LQYANSRAAMQAGANDETTARKSGTAVFRRAGSG